MEVRPGYKQTELGVIPEDWEERHLGAICKLINGRGFKPHEWKSSGLPIIRIQNLNGSDEFNYFDGQYAKKLEVAHGQLLFAWSGSRGTSFGPHIWNGSLGLLNYHTWKVVVNEQEISKDFFLHALRALTKFIEDRAHGASALVHTQKWEMEGFKLPVPLLPEQRAIAEALGDVDELLGALDRLIAKKRDLKQAAMQQLLTGQTRLPGFTGKWEVKRLCDIATIATGNTPPTNDHSNYGDEYLFVSPVDLGESKFITHTEKMLSKKGYSSVRRFPAFSILFVSIGSTIGKCGIAKLELTSNQQINAVFPAANFSVEYLYYAICEVAPRIKGQAGEQAVPIVNKTQFSQTDVWIPSLPEQTAIAEVLSDMDSEIEALEQRREKTRLLKQGMMQELLTGRTRIV